MDHQTRAFLAMAMSENVEGRFALLDLFTEEGREYERLHHDFKLLDEVFADFFETNRHRGRCWTLEEILGIKTSHPGKEFGYSSSHVPYFSTVWCYEGRDSDVITLKLHNDGFAYVSYPGMRTTRHHSIKGDQPGWVEMPMEDIKKQIPAIMARVTPLYTSARVWYNFALQKLDLLFTAPENANMPELTIGFEKGRPAYQLTSIECVLTTSACNCLEAGQGCISAGTCVIFASLMFAENRYPVLSYPILSLASHLWESACCCPTWQQSNSTSSRVKICCKTMFDNLLPESDVEQPLA